MTEQPKKVKYSDQDRTGVWLLHCDCCDGTFLSLEGWRRHKCEDYPKNPSPSDNNDFKFPDGQNQTMRKEKGKPLKSKLAGTGNKRPAFKSQDGLISS